MKTKFLPYKKLLSIVLFCILLVQTGLCQETLAGWTFPTTTGNNTTNIIAECGTMSANATIYLDGTNGSDDWLSTTGSTVYFAGQIPTGSLCTVTTATGALSLVNTGSAFNNKGIVFKLDLTNYENLVLTYSTRGTATGFANHEWLYSTDGVSFTSVLTIPGRNVTTFSTQTVDFSTATSLNNSATVYIKLIFSGASGTGNNRLDNVNFTATLIPAITPTITVTPSTLSGFNYIFGNGPSAEQIFDVSGTNLTNDIIISLPANYDISLSNAPFTSETADITLTQTGGTVANTTIYVRLKSGLSVGNQDEIINLTSIDATAKTVSCTGTVSAPVIDPTQLVITDINSGNSPLVNSLFTITVQSQDPSNTASNVITNTDFDITVATGTGALTGTITGTILAGTNSAIITGMKYDVAETGVSVTVTRNAGDILSPGTSSTFTVLDTANHLSFVNVPATGIISSNISTFTVEALRADNSLDINFTGNITIAKLSGSGNITGTLSTNAVAGVATFNDIQFDVADTYTISATSGTLTPATSGNIVITPPPSYLAVGDISIIGLNSANPDNFTFVTWVDLPANTIIKFTDNAFLSAASATLANNARGGENFVIWTSPSTVLPAGSVVRIDTISASVGTATGGSVKGLNGLSGAGDQIFCYQGAASSGTSPDFTANTNPTTFNGVILYGLNYKGTGTATSWLTTGTPTASTSYLPTELNVTYGNIEFQGGGGEFTLPRNDQTTLDAYKTLVNDPANWSTFTVNTALNTTDFTLAEPASQFAVTSVNSGNSPIANHPFDITVETQNSSNLAANVLTNTDFTISVATGSGLVSGTISGTILAGTNTVTVSGLIYNTAETGVSLTVARTAGDILTDGTSSTFTVLDTANHLQFVNVPATGYTSINLTSFTVEAIRADNSLDINFNGNVTIAKISGTGNITGTLSANAVSGVATFSDIQFDAADTYTISASSGTLTNSTSGNIIISDIPANATQLAFVNFPATGITSVMVNTFTVEARKADNSIDAAYNTDITIAVASGIGNMTGTVTTTPVSGVATFTDIQFDAADTYTISATSGTLPLATSSNIVISDPAVATELQFVGTPATGTTGVAIASFTVEARTAGGTVDAAFTGDITLTVATGAGNMTGTTTVTAISGIATFSDIQFDAPDTYTLTATSGTLTNGTSGNIVITNAFLPANLPTTYNWAPLSSYPQGWINNGLTLYTTQGFPSADAGRFDTQGDNIVINYVGTADSLIYYIRGNSLSGAYQFDVMESTDGITYTNLVSHTSTTNLITTAYTKNVAFPAPTTQFVKLVYTTKVSGNIGIDSTTITAKIFPTKLVVTSVNNGNDPTVNAPFDVVIEAQDANGTPASVVNNTDILLSVATGTGTLTGTLTGTITAGTNSITLSGIFYNTVETGVSLTAARTSGDILTDGTSSLFNVLDAADHLQFSNVPATGSIAINIAPFTVEALRSDNSVDANYTGSVTIALASGTGTMSGTTTVNAVSGVATFTDIQFDAADTYTISASSGLLTGTISGNIIISEPVATQLAFVNVPAAGITSVNINSFTVEARKADNTIDANYTSDITITVASGTGNMTGTTTVAAIAGIATFNDIQFDAADTYSISAASGLLSGATSGNIIISNPAVATHLTFLNVPSTGTVGVNITSFTVEARKDDNSVDADYATDITLAIVTGSGNISGTLTVTPIAGIATFNDIQFNAADTFTISASSGTLLNDTSGNIIISAPLLPANLPTSYDWAPSTAYPQGWINNGLSFYTTGNIAPNSGRIDTQGDNLTVFYDTSACIIEYYLKGNSLVAPYQLDLMESVDGITYSVVKTHSDLQNSLTSTYQYFSATPALNSRYVKFNYTVKTTGNIAIDDVLIDICLGINSEKNTSAGIKLYPNPVKQILHVENIAANASISIINILGEVVYSSSNFGNSEITIDAENMIPGMYILTIKNTNGTVNSVRFIKD